MVPLVQYRDFIVKSIIQCDFTVNSIIHTIYTYIHTYRCTKLVMMYNRAPRCGKAGQMLNGCGQ